MAEVNLAEEHRETTKAKKIWNSRTFAELFAYSAVEAAMYAVDCNVDTSIHGMSALDYIKQQKGIDYGVASKQVEEATNEILNNPETEEKKEYTEDDIRDLLKKKEIEFHPRLGMKKLVELATKHNLI